LFNLVFVSIALFNLLGFPLSAFPSMIASTVEASVSVSRLLKFFLKEEQDEKAVIYEYVPPNYSLKQNPIERINIQDGVFSWSRTGIPSLGPISINVSDGELVAIVGPVGSFKSTLLSSLLGDPYRLSGSVKIRGTIAYVPQTPWIMNATVRENIIFGKPYDKEKYQRTLFACGLIKDLQSLIAGDMTEIGERGINLSGGQKQRVSIARAVYSGADIYLFDDALSAVDAHVGRHIFDHVLSSNGMLSAKARVLVTHGIQYLPRTDKILILMQGKLGEVGTYSELMAKKKLLFNLINEFGTQTENTEDDQNDTFLENFSSDGINAVILGYAPDQSSKNMPGGMMTQEHSAKGKVEWAVYMTYAKACSAGLVIAFILIAVVAQGFSVSQNLLLTAWADYNDKNEKLFAIFEKSSTISWLVVYGLLGIGYSTLVVVQILFAWVYCGIGAATMLHSKLLNNILHLPMSFFDTTPLGRIMNRFSKDQYTIDEVLPRSFLGYFRTLFAVISVLAVNTYGNPFYLLFMIPLGLIYSQSQKYYLSTSRELKRLDSTSRSPVYSNFQETLSGIISIRAFGQQERFIKINEEKVDYNQRAYYPSISSNRWLAVRLEFIGALIVFGSAVFGLLSLYYFKTQPSVIGLMLVYALG
jgi:ATP-binding cassette, subfamily C (CFTR/MRP), member 1